MDYPGKVITKNQVTPTQTSATGVWTLDDAAAATRNNNWPVAGVPNPISKSLRFNSADTAYLNRTFGTSTNQSIFTYSVWVKLGRAIEATTNYGELLSGYTASSDTGFGEFAIYNGKLRFSGWATSWRDSTQVFRDPSAWYHFVLAVDTTQATAANRIKMYVNGSEITAFSTSNNPTQNSTIGVNNNSTTGRIGQDAPASSSRLFDGYMTEINFIDGQALTPSSFGMTDPVTGVWEPLKYSGTYGTNGFYLNFKDATSTTTLGYDYSGNANNWTTNNFSVTAGVGNDSLTDVPTPWVAYNTTGDVGGVVRGNYATLNPLQIGSSTTLNNGNLDSAATASSFNTTMGTVFASTGKWYAEVTILDVSADYSTKRVGVGIITSTGTEQSSYLGSSTSGYAYYANATRFNNATSASYGATYVTNDVIGIALDLDAGTLVFYKNNTSQGTAYSSLSGLFTFAVSHYGSGAKVAINFGQRPFAYTPPSGFRSLCTTNLPASTVLKGGDYFNPVLYTGNDTARSITGVGFQPDLVWLKSRSNATVHRIFDSVRGATRTISSNLTDAEAVESQQLTSFNSDGFSLGTDAGANGSGRTFVTWNWKAGGTAVTNTAGSITSSVSANTTSGFSIATFTTPSSFTNATVGHGLGVAPSMIIVKRRTTGDWITWHTSLGTNGYVTLNTTSASSSNSGSFNGTSSTTWTLGSNAWWQASASDWVAYCFAAISGFSAFGSYTGNGSTDGPFVYTGFRPAFVLIKRSSAVESWCLMDSKREGYNVDNDPLFANLSNAEGTQDFLDLLSNGFKLRSTDTGVNGSGTYIYMAFAENPFKNALAR
jgi:hypothetical protein